MTAQIARTPVDATMKRRFVDAVFRDYYPLPGTRIKQYVVDERRDTAWERETCPRLCIGKHSDNTGVTCSNIGCCSWLDASHASECDECNDIAERERDRSDIVAWRAERGARPKPCADRDQLSDEIAPDFPVMRDHPLLAAMRTRGRP